MSVRKWIRKLFRGKPKFTFIVVQDASDKELKAFSEAMRLVSMNGEAIVTNKRVHIVKVY